MENRGAFLRSGWVPAWRAGNSSEWGLLGVHELKGEGGEWEEFEAEGLAATSSKVADVFILDQNKYMRPRS